MANVNGTAGNDFIHVNGDGEVPPLGSVNNPGATNSADQIVTGAGDDTVFAGGGDDTVNFVSNFTLADYVTGGDGFDTLQLSGDYSGLGVLGATQLNSIENIRVLAGFRYDINLDDANVAAGQTLRFNATALGVGDTLYVGAGGDTDASILVFGGAGIDYLHGGYGVSNEMYGYGGNDFLDGSAALNKLDGGAGDDQIYVYGGSSNIVGGDGADLIDAVGMVLSLNAGADADNVTVGNATLAGNINGGAGTDGLTILSSIAVNGNLSLAAQNFETLLINAGAGINGNDLDNVINLAVTLKAGSTGATVFGNGGNDFLTGTSLVDNLDGGAGNDTITSGAGADSMAGGANNDVYLNPGSNDSIVELFGQGIDTVQSNVHFTIAPFAYVENLTLTGAANIIGTGNSENNVITGNTGNNSLSGLIGNDTLIGGDGNDTLSGSDGDDILNGGAGTDTLGGGIGNDIYINPTGDTINEAAGAGFDSVQSDIGFSIASLANIERILLTGGANTSATGNAAANILNGNTGNNTMQGGDGNDTINGNAGIDLLDGNGGNDSLNGGAGADTFRFQQAGAGTDRIAGFDQAQDHFNLFGGTFTGKSEGGGNTTLTHAGGTVIVEGVTGLNIGAWNALVQRQPYFPEVAAPELSHDRFFSDHIPLHDYI